MHSAFNLVSDYNLNSVYTFHFHCGFHGNHMQRNRLELPGNKVQILEQFYFLTLCESKTMTFQNSIQWNSVIRTPMAVSKLVNA